MKMFNRSAVVLTAALMLGGVGTAQATSVNLVQNGDFESGTYTSGANQWVPNDWTASGNWSTGNNFVGVPTLNNDALYLGNDPSQGLAGIAQTIGNTVAGQSYTLSMDWTSTYEDNSTSSPFFEVLWNGKVVETIDTIGASFQTLTLTAIGDDVLTLLGSTGGGFFYNIVDNVNLTSVSAVPLPGTALLFGSGLIGLIGFSKKRALRKAA